MVLQWDLNIWSYDVWDIFWYRYLISSLLGGNSFLFLLLPNLESSKSVVAVRSLVESCFIGLQGVTKD